MQCVVCCVCCVCVCAVCCVCRPTTNLFYFCLFCGSIQLWRLQRDHEGAHCTNHLKCERGWEGHVYTKKLKVQCGGLVVEKFTSRLPKQKFAAPSVHQSIIHSPRRHCYHLYCIPPVTYDVETAIIMDSFAYQSPRRTAAAATTTPKPWRNSWKPPHTPPPSCAQAAQRERQVPPAPRKQQRTRPSIRGQPGVDSVVARLVF